MSRTRNAAVNGALVISSILVSVGLLEVGLRLVDNSAEPKPPGHHALCCEYHPTLGWRHKPNTNIEIVRSEYRITESFNSRGVRGPEYTLAKRPGEYRIVVVGDSFAEGITVGFDQLFSEVMKRRLNASGDSRFQVINMGVAGYSTDQQLLQFRMEGRDYQPDVTVLLVYDNDIWFNAQARYTMMGRGNKPMFLMDGDELRRANDPVPRGTLSGGTKRSKGLPSNVGFTGINGVKRLLGEQSHAYRWVRERIRNTASLNSLFVFVGLMNQHENRRIPVAYGIYERSYSPETEYAWSMTRALIAELKREVESTGSRFVLAHAPFKATIHDEDWVQFKRNYGVTDALWSPYRVNQELAGIAAELKIDFLNPVEALRGAANEKRVYFAQDTHWNEHGNRVVGEVLAEHIGRLAAVELQAE